MRRIVGQAYMLAVVKSRRSCQRRHAVGNDVSAFRRGISRAFAGGMLSGTGGAKTASLYEGGVERSETAGVIRLRRMRNAETAFPTPPVEGSLLDSTFTRPTPAIPQKQRPTRQGRPDESPAPSFRVIPTTSRWKMPTVFS